jgi:peptidoglycan/LPS O-acetylase OafA/YrhL
VIRLAPAMLICSLITFVGISVFDSNNLFPNSHNARNVLFSITFLSPELLSKTLLNLNYTNGSYWSLWPEIQFYFISSLIYFINKRRFYTNFLLFAVSCSLLNFLTLKTGAHFHQLDTFYFHQIKIKYIEFESVFNFDEYALFFAIGIVCFKLYSKEQTLRYITVLFFLVFLLLCTKDALVFHRIKVYHSVFIMVLAFLCFIYAPKLIHFMIIKPIAKIGMASYSLYLIHENLGVLIINKWGNLFGKYNFIFPILIILLMSLFSIYLYKYVEKPLVAY